MRTVHEPVGICAQRLCLDELDWRYGRAGAESEQYRNHTLPRCGPGVRAIVENADAGRTAYRADIFDLHFEYSLIGKRSGVRMICGR